MCQRRQQPESDSDPLGQQATRTKCGFVLQPEEVQAIRDDISSIIRPSWLTSVPAQLGNASHGKLKADQWRVLGTTFLPLSLIRLWHAIDAETFNERALRCAQILDTTLSLLSAVMIALSDTTTHSHADAMQQHLLDYLRGLKELFPDYRFRPNHHMALHLPEYIKLFGPVHSWWAFPFERVIGMLQRISTNYQPGIELGQFRIICLIMANRRIRSDYFTNFCTIKQSLKHF